MFKNIQNYLLLRHPLLWNIKVVPMLVVSVVINILFLIGGYINGEIDFTEYPNSEFSLDATLGFVAFFNVILSLLLFILWMVYYTRNNAYKYFYPKSNTSLYKEWLLILIICLFNCAYTVSFLYGREIRLQSYYTKEEAQKRVDILSKASMFTEGNYFLDADTIIDQQDVHRQFFKFKGRQYKYSSLLNKRVLIFSLQDSHKDSVNRLTVQHWLAANKKDSVYNVLKQFMAIAAEHHLKSNITAQQWLDKVYNNPDYTQYIVIGKNDYAPIYGYNYYSELYKTEEVYEQDIRKIDPASNIKKIVNGREEIYPKYYVAQDQLQNAYDKISDAYVNPPLKPDMLIGIVCLSIVLSMLVLSFRVTSGKDWLIALVSFGVTAIITGIFSAVITGYFFRNVMLIDDEYFFLTIWVAIVLVLLAYFIYVRKKNLSKRLSAIILNHLLWLLPAVVPVIFAIALNVSEEFNVSIYKPNDEYEIIYNPVYLFFEQCSFYIIPVNIVLVFIYMYFFSTTVKKWKGIAEG